MRDKNSRPLVGIGVMIIKNGEPKELEPEKLIDLKWQDWEL